MRKKLFGVGINDADYPVSPIINGKREYCPFYLTWRNMITRVYSGCGRPTYKDVVVCNEWLTFSNFRSWMITQEWKGLHLDKDLLIPGNKEYNPKACLFVSRKVNNFMLERAGDRGKYPIGVYWDNTKNCFKVQISYGGKMYQWYNVKNPEEGHKIWLKGKLKFAKLLASEQSDTRVAEALIKRYTDYQSTEEI